MGRLNNSEFLTKVNEHLTANEGKSSVYFTQKRLELDLEASADQISDLASNVIEQPDNLPKNSQTYPVLIRLTLGEKTSKISTVVEPQNLDQFWNEYAQILKSGLVGLKRDKKKTKRSKVTKA